VTRNSVSHHWYYYDRHICLQDAIQNENYSKIKLTMPTIVHEMETLAQNARGILVSNSGYWIPEEHVRSLQRLKISSMRTKKLDRE
jgi:hypothetical protein